MRLGLGLGTTVSGGGGEGAAPPLNPPALVNNAAIGANTSQTAVTVPLPTGGAGDIMFMMGGCIASNTAFSVSDGWTELWQGNVGDNRYGFWWKRRVASESTPTLTNTGRTSTNLLTGAISSYNGAKTEGTPVRNVATTSSASGALTGPNVETDGRNSKAITLWVRLGANTAATPDDLWTEDRDNGTGGGGAGRYYVDSQNAPWPGTYPASLRGGSGIHYAACGFELLTDNPDPSVNYTPARGLWAWDTVDIVTDADERDHIIASCERTDITDIYMYVDPATISTNQADITTFIGAATTAGVRIWGLDGSRAYFADADGRDGLIDSVNAVIAYNAQVSANQRFHGFHINCEPNDLMGYTSFHNGVASSGLSSTPGSGDWQDTEVLDREFLMRDWIDMHGEIRAICSAAGMDFGTAVPAWFDDYFGEPVLCTVNGTEANVFVHMCGVCKNICLMTYNTNPRSVITRFNYEILNVVKRAKVSFSQETHEGVGNNISYADTAGKDSEEAVLGDADILIARFIGYPGFGGSNIHDWVGWKAMLPPPDIA